MKATLTRQAVNHVNKMCKSVPDGVFIDKLKDGRRSLKVWGWTAAQYAHAIDFLLARGCHVHVVKTRPCITAWPTQEWSSYSEGYLRLHVKES